MSSRVTVARLDRRPRLARLGLSPALASRLNRTCRGSIPASFPLIAHVACYLYRLRVRCGVRARVRAAMSAGLEARKTLGAPPLRVWNFWGFGARTRSCLL